MDLTEDLAEFTGVLFGDGCLSKYFSKSDNRERYEIAFTGALDEFSYYNNFMKTTLENHFNAKGRVFLRGNSTRFHIKNKKVFDFFVNLGTPIGKKSFIIEIPKQILNNSALSKAFLRGLWNADGSIYRRYSKSYGRHPRIYKEYLVMQLKLNSKKILKQVKLILDKENIKSTKLSKDKVAFVLRICEQKQIEKFLSKINFSNPHHLKRLELLRNQVNV